MKKNRLEKILAAGADLQRSEFHIEDTLLVIFQDKDNDKSGIYAIGDEMEIAHSLRDAMRQDRSLEKIVRHAVECFDRHKKMPDLGKLFDGLIDSLTEILPPHLKADAQIIRNERMKRGESRAEWLERIIPRLSPEGAEHARKAYSEELSKQ